MRTPVLHMQKLDTDQLRGNQRLYFLQIRSTIFLYFLNSKLQAPIHLCGCTDRFASDLVGNSENRIFSLRGSFIYVTYVTNNKNLDIYIIMLDKSNDSSYLNYCVIAHFLISKHRNTIPFFSLILSLLVVRSRAPYYYYS